MPLHNKTGKRYHRKKLPIKYADGSLEQVYARIDKALGNCSFYVITCKEGEQKVASLSGITKKQGRAKMGDVVLIEPMSEDTNRKYQIIFKYSHDQVRILEKEGFLTAVEESKNVENDGDEILDGEICFDGDEIETNTIVNDIDENFIDDI
jgi:initiation factor 1A